MSFEDEMWKEAMELQKFAASQFKIPYKEAAKWVNDTGIVCIEKKHLYDPQKSTLKAWMKAIMLNIYRDEYRKEKNDFYLNNKDKFIINRPIKIDEDSIMTLDNDKNIVKIVTKTPHKASINDKFRLKNIKGIDSNLLKSIDTVIDVIDDKTIHTTIINPELVFFKAGGSKATIEILNFRIEERKPSYIEVDNYFEKQNSSFIQDAFDSCRKKLDDYQNKIIDFRFAEVACVRCGDVHNAIKKNNKFECSNIKWVVFSSISHSKLFKFRFNFYF